jgi:hypothetical protein
VNEALQAPLNGVDYLEVDGSCAFQEPWAALSLLVVDQVS